MADAIGVLGLLFTGIQLMLELYDRFQKRKQK